ncbi:MULTISPECIES: hypothetical protein [unclassified Streptomyces]|uniref:hypothetical protein n=1 Tax=unclassified Streptomyces TaxID=2593676 RepID=UPI00202F9F84|nr:MULTISPECIES: hypothetical protein [unclassified Streptomyces]MCM1975704.1 hypothetical protein [Streptomyces sp. G1]MCX5123093.1 hypothetical protein [Streptomyces sp. NBC_00347]
MRTAFVRRTVLSASAVSLALLVTACGGSAKSDAKPDAKTSASAPAAAGSKAKTAAELVPLLVAQADLPDHVLKPATEEEVKAGADLASDKPACLPLIQAQSMAPVGTAAGTARIKGVAKPKAADPDASEAEKAKAGLDALGSTVTAVALSSYEGKGAEEAFASLKSAGTACAGGFGVRMGGEPGKISKVAPAAPVTAGDEALAYSVELEDEELGEKATTELVVVRKGNSLVTFSALSLAGNAEQPKAIVAAQVKKLG